MMLAATTVIGEGIRTPKDGCLKVSFRQGGERCRPSGRAHSTSLKKCLQEFGLEPWWRDQVPLIFIDEELVAVAMTQLMGSPWPLRTEFTTLVYQAIDD